MKIALACDHAGYELKEKIKKYLSEKGYEILDCGTDSAEPVDYPIYGKACAEKVVSDEAERGICCCGSGIGIGIAANKVRGARCALCNTVEMAELSRKHNDANMISLGGRLTDHELCLRIVDAFLSTDFIGEHHTKRVEMLDNM